MAVDRRSPSSQAYLRVFSPPRIQAIVYMVIN